MNTRKIIKGLVTGLAIGTTLGMLYAPNKGSVTRRKLARTRNRYVGELEDKFSEFVETVTEKFDSIKEDAQRVSESMKAKVKEPGS